MLLKLHYLIMCQENPSRLVLKEFMFKGDFKAIIIDVSGSWLANGWNPAARWEIARLFNFNYKVLEKKHLVNYQSYQYETMSFNRYVELLSFGQRNPVPMVTLSDIVRSKLYSNKAVLNYLKRLKYQYGIQIIAVNNSSQLSNDLPYPISFLKGFVDFFISPSKNENDLAVEVGLTRALQATKLYPWEVICFDNRINVIDKAIGLGLKVVLHEELNRTKLLFKRYGIKVNI